MKLPLLSHLTIIGLMLSAVFLIGCTSNPIATDETTTPSPTSTTGTAASPTLPGGPPGPPPTPDPSGILRVPARIIVVDVKTGASRTLYESFSSAAFDPRFEGSEVVYGVHNAAQQLEQVRVGVDGREISRAVLTSPGSEYCRPTANGAEVEGRFYDGASCGLISPDKLWMTYTITTRENVLPSGYRQPVWDQWAVNLKTDERRMLQDGLVHCGGCDGRFGPEWSPSGRFLFFAELAGQGRTFLSDLQAGSARVLSTGDTQLSFKPNWAPGRDLLLYAGSTSAVLEDLPATSKLELTGVAWPARFDATGAFIYSPGWSEGTESSGGTTAVYDVKAGRVVAGLPGQAPYSSLFVPYVPLGASATGFVAALEGAPGCQGAAIYSGSKLVKCVAGASGPTISPDGSTVAVARHTGQSGQYTGPNGMGGVSGDLFEIVLVDIASGNERVVLKDVLGIQGAPPATWNDDGTHILVRWPVSYGL